MNDKQRREIVEKYKLNDQTYKSIAAEMGITPAAISVDRNRYKEAWAFEKE